VTAFYNEWERYPASWIRNLIAAGHVADGIVDERSIVELRATDLAATQCHLFAGVAGWSYALRLAGWPDDRPVWTTSCPCQPFSTAGKGRGTDDERHLWPVVFELVRQCRPPILFGEQVASPAGRGVSPVVARLPRGVGRLRAEAPRAKTIRGYGNSIVAPLAAAFIRAVMS